MMHTTSSIDFSRKKTILFDLDGTLVDIEPVFIKIANMLAPEFGFAPIHSEEIPELKKFHLKNLIWKRLGWRIIFLPKILKRGREEYNKIAIDVPLFPGMKDVLTILHSRGYRIGIVSSSRKDTIWTIVTHHALPIDFFYHGKLFNKAQSLKEVLSKEKLILAETVYIGDEIRDKEACQKINLDIISVSWGLNDREALQKAGAKIIIDKPSLLFDTLACDREKHRLQY